MLIQYIGNETTHVTPCLASGKIHLKKGDVFKCEPRYAETLLRSYADIYKIADDGASVTAKPEAPKAAKAEAPKKKATKKKEEA